MNDMIKDCQWFVYESSESRLLLVGNNRESKSKPFLKNLTISGTTSSIHLGFGPLYHKSSLIHPTLFNYRY